VRYLAALAAIVVSAVGVLAAPASASTARLVDVEVPYDCKFGPCPPAFATVLLYEAAPAEANRVSVERSADAVRVSDPGAVIEAGERCESVDQRNVRCTAANRIALVFVDAGDGADRVRSGEVVDGGPGNDVLVGGGQLFGGRGADVLRGSGETDHLYDASPRDPFGSSDLSRFIVESSPAAAPVPLADPGRGRDSFDGGAGHDTISYEGRGTGVRVDLANASAIAGARREHDSVRDFESAIGGDGDDRLTGNNHRVNQLDGGDGDDRILGRRGADHIEGGTGRNVIRAGPGDDQVNATARAVNLGAERIFCGSGMDRTSWIYPSDFVNDDCEELEFNFLRDDGGLFGGVLVSHLPLDEDEPPIVFSTGELWCYFVVNPSGCRLTLEVRVQRRGRLLGSQSYTFAPDERRTVTAELSAAGMRILRRHESLLVRVRVVEDGAPRQGGYLTVLRVP
jgi:Ca2+-binding RTX toxin-like protein